MSKRTTYCGLVTEDLLNEKVTLKGWVHNRRDLGGLIFIDLRDREGIVQIVFNPDFSQEALNIAETVRSEYIVEVQGVVTKRDAETVNPKIKTGQVEVQVSNIEIINKSETPPFSINEENKLLTWVSLHVGIMKCYCYLYLLFISYIIIICCICNDKNIYFFKSKTWSFQVGEHMGVLGGGSLKEAMKAPHPFPMPCLVHLSHLAEPKLHHFIINWRSSK